MTKAHNRVYTEEEKNDIFDKIIKDIKNGLSVRKILEGEGMPANNNLLKWIEEHPGWDKRYARAKQESAESDADNVNYIAELCLSGEVDSAVARVAIDAYKWSSGKKKPKKYGDMIKIDYNQLDENVKPDVDFDDIKL